MIRILLVDDDSVDREICEYYLKKLGNDFKITTIGSSIEALELFRSENFDCVLSDMQMPEMSGLEFLSTIRGCGDSTPFIILSGQKDKKLALEAFSADVDDYFPKDAGFALYERLAHSIRKVVKSYRGHQQMISLQKETKRA